MTRLTAGLLLILLAGAPCAAAEPDEATYAKLNEALVANYVVPRYDRLVEATAGLPEKAQAFCASRDGAALAALRGAFNIAMDAWQGVQHMRFGPAELFLRGTRFGFWPDARNATGRQMAELLKSRDASAFEGDALAHGNIAAQGLPALERLLFDEEAKAPWPEGADGDFHCTYLKAIAANLAQVAKDIRTDWTEPPRAHDAAMAAAGGADALYPSHKDATLDLFKSLVAAVEVVAERKLTRAMGETPAGARPRLGESWRSGRSMENIRRNLETAEAMYLGSGGYGFSDIVREVAGKPELDDLLRRAFARTRETAQSVTLPLRDAVESDVLRPRLEQLATEAAALRALLSRDLAPALGVPVGFNALDGD